MVDRETAAEFDQLYAQESHVHRGNATGSGQKRQRQGSARPSNQFAAPNRGRNPSDQQQPIDQEQADGQDYVDQDQQAKRTATRSHAAKMSKQQADWIAIDPCLKRRAVWHVPLHAHIKASSQQHKQQGLDQLLAESWRFHACPALEGGAVMQESMIKPLNARKAVYFSMDHRFEIVVPKWQCACCQQEIKPQPQDVGCWGSTAGEPYR